MTTPHTVTTPYAAAAPQFGRRSALAALAATALLTAAGTAPARAATRAAAPPSPPGRPPRLMLPAPTGPHPVGTTTLHLVDPARPDRWAPTPRPRELRTRLWYPAARVAGHPRAPWMSPAETAHLETAYFQVPAAGLDWPTTHAHTDAPAETSCRHPVVLNSHGSGGDSAFNTALAEELASHGHVVGAGGPPPPPPRRGGGGPPPARPRPIAPARARPPAPRPRPRGPPPVEQNPPGSGGDSAFNPARAEELASPGHVVAAVDHTFDAGEIEFPGHRLEVRDKAAVQAMTDADIVAYRAADVRLVLDRLTDLAAGADPDADHRPLPAGLAQALDPEAVAMFGHSMGGATTAQALHDDPRIRAGAVLDGPLFGTCATADQPRPLLLMASTWASPARDAMWDTLWPHLTGWRRRLTLTRSGHLSYTDLQLLVPQGQDVIAWPADQLEHFLGTGDPLRAVTAQRAYLTAYFQLHLRRRPTTLFDAPSPHYPEITLDA
ncbi:serine aminopeptidase domain-containing protein [Kitasatospora sp. NPDC059817]|uniref:alpha/beta hydrolase n=1 Tax=Kitasatospora sp. NPDC059817 TaxID=3346961 RepID=UPI003666D76B